MAIIKEVQTPFGAAAGYHRIVKAEIDVSTQTIEVMVAIYISAEARDGGAPPLWHEYVRIPFRDLSQDPRRLLYSMLNLHISSYLQGGQADVEDSGNLSITLTEEALGLVEPVVEPAPVAVEPEQVRLPPPPPDISAPTFLGAPMPADPDTDLIPESQL